jgi:hypothetical protein
VNRLRIFHVLGSHPEASSRYLHHACWSIL